MIVEPLHYSQNGTFDNSTSKRFILDIYRIGLEML